MYDCILEIVHAHCATFNTYYEEYKKYKNLVEYDPKNKEAVKRMNEYKKVVESQIIVIANYMNSEKPIKDAVEQFNEEWKNKE